MCGPKAASSGPSSYEAKQESVAHTPGAIKGTTLQRFVGQVTWEGPKEIVFSMEDVKPMALDDIASVLPAAGRVSD